MGLKVLGAGFGRTGTHSLQLALNTLGFGPCYHMFEVAKNPSHNKIWLEAIEDKPVNWQELFKAYQSAVDWPAAAFVPQLLDVFPDVKIVLTLRDPEDWYQSISKTIFTSLAIEGKVRGMVGSSRKNMASQLFKRVFSGRYKDKEYILEAFDEHLGKVEEWVPRESLLKYRVTEGWQPLCEFLGVPVPDLAFPRSNDRQSFQSPLLLRNHS